MGRIAGLPSQIFVVAALGGALLLGIGLMRIGVATDLAGIVAAVVCFVPILALAQRERNRAGGD